MSLEQQIADLTTATTDLLDAVNVRKSVLDDAVQRVNDAVERLYAGTYDVAPETRPGGSQILDGDRYINSLDGYEYIRVNGSWSNSSSAIQAAQIQADRASSFSAQAEAQAVRAEAARDAAQLSAGVYATTTAGLAATTNGQYFNVPASLANDSLILYQNSSGTAVEVKRYPAAAALDFKKNTSSSGFQVSDSAGHLILDVQSPAAVKKDGTIETDAVTLLPAKGFWAYSVGDGSGRVLFGVDSKGRLVANFDLVPEKTPAKTGGIYDYEINHVLCYGQSLSIGQTPTLASFTQDYDNLMFYRGMRPELDYPGETAATWYQSLVPAVESQSPANTSLRETPSMGTGDMVKALIRDEDRLTFSEISYQLMLSNPGEGAKTILELSKGTAYYSRLLSHVAAAKALADAAGKSYAVQAVTWMQGESDFLNTTREQYATRLNTLVTDLNADIKAITGQAKDVHLFTYQVVPRVASGANVTKIAYAHRDVASSNPLVHLAMPMYFFEYADGLHLLGPDSRWAGAYFGLAYKRIVIDGEDWKPLDVTGSQIAGNSVYLTFHVPSGHLALDTTTVVEAPGMGFGVLDALGNAVSISSVKVVAPNKLKITCASPVSAGYKIDYGINGGSAASPTSGPRGNLRDTQGDLIVFDPNGINKPMHNWCVNFELEL